MPTSLVAEQDLNPGLSKKKASSCNKAACTTEPIPELLFINLFSVTKAFQRSHRSSLRLERTQFITAKRPWWQESVPWLVHMKLDRKY